MSEIGLECWACQWTWEHPADDMFVGAKVKCPSCGEQGVAGYMELGMPEDDDE